MLPIPKQIKRLGEGGIEITWDSAVVHTLTSETLRMNCPSADNRAKLGAASHDKPLGGRGLLRVVKHSAESELRLLRIWAVGNYAIGMQWADGHRSGIYSYELLYALGEQQMVT